MPANSIPTNRRLLEIVATADRGCSYCVTDLFQQIVAEFPLFKEDAIKIFKTVFNKDIRFTFDQKFDNLEDAQTYMKLVADNHQKSVTKLINLSETEYLVAVSL